MINRLFAFITVLLIAPTVCAVEITDPLERSTMNVFRAPTHVKIDGILSPEEWGGAEVGKMSMDVFKPDRPPKQPTFVRAMWDDKYLYVSFECIDSDVWGTMSKFDSAVFTEEAVEIFIDPEGRYRHYYEIDAGPRGGVIDLMIPGARLVGGKTNSTYDVRGLLVGVKVYGTLDDRTDRDEKWTAEFAIPWADFKGRRVNVPPKNGDTWRINFYRIDRPADKADEYLAWSKSVGAFHEPRNFGVIVFKGD